MIICRTHLYISSQDIADVYTDLMKAAGASRKVFELIDREPAIKNDGTLSPRQLDGHLELKNVKFAYPTRSTTPVLKVSTQFCANSSEMHVELNYTYTGGSRTFFFWGGGGIR